MNAPRVAIIHYWLVRMRGGERVLERMLKLYPQADVFTHVYVPEAMSSTIRAANVRTTFINRLPFARRWYQRYLPLMPYALEQLDLRGYDLVLSSEAGPAKGVIADPAARHLCYCHSPMRYIWDQYHEYLDASNVLTRAVMRPAFHQLRVWDTASAARIDHVVANSAFIQQRIRRAWRRDSEVIHPPVSVTAFTPAPTVSPRFLWVGAMVRYKRPDLAVDAFNRLKLPLLMVGEGEQFQALKQRAGPTIEMVERMSFPQLQEAYASCRALVFTAEEDFGIVPVEANASGRPVIAYGRAGVLDSIVPNETGLFFAEQTVESLADAIERCEAWLPHFSPAAAVANAGRFAPEVFDRRLSEAVTRMMAT